MKRWIPFVKSPPRVAVIRLQGVIASGPRGGLNDQALRPVIEKAFSRGKPAAVALEINSPGGSPVQSALIAGRIRRLAEEKNIPVYAFVEDVAASGGYWLALAGDEIWADAGSVVGSIGVISASFGAHVFLTRNGLERRVHTAGKSKTMLDPFQPEKPEDVKRLRGLLNGLHEVFIDQVKTRRGDRLSASEDLFTGEVWLASQAIENGLIDGLGQIDQKLREKFGKDVKLRRYGLRRSVFQRFGANLVNDAIAGLEERAEYARYGL